MNVACPICDKVVSFPGLQKHVFGSAHSHSLPSLLLDSNSASDLRLPGRLPIIRNKKEDKSDLHLCFGCKKCWLTPKPSHLDECTHAEKHRATVKSISEGTSLVSVDTKAKDAEIEALKKQVQKLEEALKKAKEGEAWEKKEREAAEAKLEALEEESGVEELQANLRSRDTLIGRLIGVTESEEMFALNEKLRIAGYKVDRPLFDLQKALDPPAAPAPAPAAAPAAPPATPSLGPNAIVTSHTTHLQTSYHPTAQQQEALGQFSGVKVLATTTKRPGKLLIPR